LSGCVPKSWWEELYRKATDTLSTMPTESERINVDHMAANYRRLLNWLSRHLKTDVWEPFRLLRSLTYTKRGDDSEREEDMRSAGIEDD
jgi:hypothetical protein